MNGQILFSIISGDRENQFFIDPITGLMKVNKELDREMVRVPTLPTAIYPRLILVFVGYAQSLNEEQYLGDRP